MLYGQRMAIADIKFYMSADIHALSVQQAFFYQIINFTGKLQI